MGQFDLEGSKPMKCSKKLARCFSSLLLMTSLLFGVLLIGRVNASGVEGHTDSNDAASKPSAQYPALATYATDLTKLARQGKLDPASEHDKAIRNIAQVLSRDSRNNPVLIAEAGF